MKTTYLKSKYQFRQIDVDVPQIGKDEVLLKVKACGFCGHEMILARYAAEDWTPFGHEISGVVEQVGMPYDIYAHPVNAFVANFIGTSNFLEAEATKEGVRVMGAAPIPAKLKDDRTGKVQVAVRPEHITLNAPQPGKLEGEIKIFTFLGDYINYEVQLANGQVIQANQYLNQKTGFHQKGEKVSIEFSTMNVFDAEGKEALL